MILEMSKQINEKRFLARSMYFENARTEAENGMVWAKMQTTLF
jgi:hypothetical protein